jgi:hypothetical protein
MTMSALSLLWLAAVPGLWAHDYPIKPVQAVLRVEPDRVVADIASDSIYWIEEVVGHEHMSPRGWPAKDKEKVERYVNEHLRLKADDRPLSGRLVWAVYVQQPWQVNEQGLFRLRLVYPSVTDSACLSGEADFFDEYRRERIEAKEPILPFMDFRVFLEVLGRMTKRFELKPGSQSFQVSIAEARRTGAARFFESLKRGASTVFELMEGWPALAALAFSMGPRSSPAFLALLAGLAWPASSARAAAGLAGIVAGVAAGRWTGEASAPWLESAALAALGASWAGAASFWLPGAAPGLLERGAAGLGAAAAAILTLSAGLLAVRLERRRAEQDSQCAAASLFQRRRRLAATVLVIMSSCGLWQELSKHP